MKIENHMEQFEGLPRPNEIRLFRKKKDEVKQDETENNLSAESTASKLAKESLHEEGDPPWRQEGKRGGRVNRGILAEWIINRYPSICVGDTFYFYRNGVYIMGSREEAAGIVKQTLGTELAQSDVISDVVNMWKIDHRVRKRPDEVNQDPYIINVRNGLIDLRTWKWKKHSPDVISTIQLNASLNSDAEGPVFERFIQRTIPDPNLRSLFQEMLGYALTTMTFSKKMIFLFVGAADTGKTTLINSTIELLVPAQAKSHVPLQALTRDRYASADLFGQTVNVFDDLSDGELGGLGFLKAATGRGEIWAQRKFGQPFSFINKAKLVFTCNALPIINVHDSGEALEKRLVILPLNQHIAPAEKDPNLEARLAEERDYILMYAMKGLRRLLESNFEFSKSEISTQLVRQYISDGNTVREFVQSNCVLGDDGLSTPKTSLYSSYLQFCSCAGLDALQKKVFYREIESQYGLRVKAVGDKRVRSYLGIAKRE